MSELQSENPSDIFNHLEEAKRENQINPETNHFPRQASSSQAIRNDDYFELNEMEGENQFMTSEQQKGYIIRANREAQRSLEENDIEGVEKQLQLICNSALLNDYLERPQLMDEDLVQIFDKTKATFAKVEMLKGNIQNANKMIHQALEQAPHNPLYWETASDIKFQNQEYIESVYAQEIAVVKCKIFNRFKNLKKLAFRCLWACQWEKGISSCLDLLSICEEVDTILMLSFFHKMKGQREQSEIILQKARRFSQKKNLEYQASPILSEFIGSFRNQLHQAKALQKANIHHIQLGNSFWEDFNHLLAIIIEVVRTEQENFCIKFHFTASLPRVIVQPLDDFKKCLLEENKLLRYLWNRSSKNYSQNSIESAKNLKQRNRNSLKNKDHYLSKSDLFKKIKRQLFSIGLTLSNLQECFQEEPACNFLQFDQLSKRFFALRDQASTQFQELIIVLQNLEAERIAIIVNIFLEIVLKFCSKLLTPITMKLIVDFVFVSWKYCKLQLNLEQLIILIEASSTLPTHSSKNVEVQQFYQNLIDLFNQKALQFKCEEANLNNSNSRLCFLHIYCIKSFILRKNNQISEQEKQQMLKYIQKLELDEIKNNFLQQTPWVSISRPSLLNSSEIRKKFVYFLSNSNNLSSSEQIIFKFIRFKNIIEDGRFDELSYFKTLKDSILNASLEDSMIILVKLMQITIETHKYLGNFIVPPNMQKFLDFIPTRNEYLEMVLFKVQKILEKPEIIQQNANNSPVIARVKRLMIFSFQSLIKLPQQEISKKPVLTTLKLLWLFCQLQGCLPQFANFSLKFQDFLNQQKLNNQQQCVVFIFQTLLELSWKMNYQFKKKSINYSFEEQLQRAILAANFQNSKASQQELKEKDYSEESLSDSSIQIIVQTLIVNYLNTAFNTKFDIREQITIQQKFHPYLMSLQLPLSSIDILL